MAAIANNYRCTMCTYVTIKWAHLTNHIVRVHKNDPRFHVSCEIDNCEFSTKSWGSFKTHMSRNHRKQDDINDNAADANDSSDDTDSDIDGHFTNVAEQRNFANAAYLLNLETRHKLTEKAVQEVVDNTGDLVKLHMHMYKKDLNEKLSARGIDVSDLLEDTIPPSVFGSLESKNRRDQFYESFCGYIPPVQVTLGKSPRKKNGRYQNVTDFGYYIPLKKTIESLYNMPEFRQCVDNPHDSTDGYMRDICDGDFVRNHPVFQQDKHALQLILNTDDLELTNPLGKNTKIHKVSMFYVAFANINPELRSKLSAIHLVAVAKTKFLRKYGTKKILKNFIDTVKELSTQGLSININGVEKVIKGALVMVTADTLGAAWIGGFKEGVSFAKRLCRNCFASKEEAKTTFTEKDLVLRTADDHRRKCATISDSTLPKATKDYWSTEWGINNVSPLLELHDFDLCNCIVQDPMHVFLEGVLPYEAALLLFHLIYNKKYFTLDWLNMQLETFPYSYLEERNKPAIIQKHDIIVSIKLKQTSASMLTLCGILPFILASKIPANDSKWKLFLLLLQITSLCTSTIVTSGTSTELVYLIEMHHSSFRREYPTSSFIPKMHYMCHFPRQIKLFGPARHHWCMRFEAKHSFFTSIKWKSFKNIPKSMALKHQKWMCGQMLSPNGQRSSYYLYAGDEVSEGELKAYTDLCATPEVQNLLIAAVPGITHFYTTKSITVRGCTYKPGCVVVLGYDHEEFPVLAILDDIYVHEHQKLLLLRKLEIIEVNEHVNAFRVSPTHTICICTPQQLFVKIPAILHLYEGFPHVFNRHSHIATLF